MLVGSRHRTNQSRSWLGSDNVMWIAATVGTIAQTFPNTYATNFQKGSVKDHGDRDKGERDINGFRAIIKPRDLEQEECVRVSTDEETSCLEENGACCSSTVEAVMTDWVLP